MEWSRVGFYLGLLLINIGMWLLIFVLFGEPIGAGWFDGWLPLV